MKLMWKGPMRVLPNIGVKSDGDVFDVDDDAAENYVRQGLAIRDMPRPRAVRDMRKTDANGAPRTVTTSGDLMQREGGDEQ